jgi:hypothetical protein
MLSYSRQVALCESVRETIKRALAQRDDARVRLRANDIPTTDAILRAVSVSPSIDTEETLKDFIIEHVLGRLRLTAVQKEQLNVNG